MLRDGRGDQVWLWGVVLRLASLNAVFLFNEHNPRTIFFSLVPIPPPADLPNQGIELGSPTLLADSLPTELAGGTSVKSLPASEGDARGMR